MDDKLRELVSAAFRTVPARDANAEIARARAEAVDEGATPSRRLRRVALLWISVTLMSSSQPCRVVSIPSVVERNRPPVKTRSWTKAETLPSRTISL